MSRALAGVRVLELTDRSAALAGRVLADLGAEVILVEPPGGAPVRHEAPFLNGEADFERAFAHLYLNTNKRSVVLDLDSPDGRERFLDLVASADVLLETQLPGRFDGLGLDHGTLRTANPRLVQCSVTPFGLFTPWRHRKANDLVAGAAGGLIQVSGEPDGIPMQGGAHPSYTMAGLAAASAITIALHQRDLGTGNGSGVHIDLSLQEATALAVMQTAWPAQWAWQRHIPARPGLSAALACRDGKYVSLLVRPDRFRGFLAWADEAGVPHTMTPDDWPLARLDAPRRHNPVPELTLRLAAALTRDEFVAGALKADIICLPVLDFPDLEREPQYQLNDQFFEIDHEVLGARLGYVRSPVDAIADGVAFRRAPCLGEDQALLESLPARARRASTGMPTAAASPPPSTALAGLRVVDFGWVLAAPIGTRLLASFGAEVIRVESSGRPDSMRGQAGPDGKPHPDLGGLFNSVNAGKKSFTVDLGKPEGIALVKELIASADIVVNNFRPGVMARLGLGFEALCAIKPDVILLNLPGAHRTGPWARHPSTGNILMAASGFNMLTGFPEERPRGIGVAYPDFTSPHLLVATILAAVRQRRASGTGQELHLTQLSSLLALLGCEWMDYQASGQQPPRNANRSPNHCPHGIFPAAREADTGLDAWVAIAVAGDAEWAAMCRVMERADLAADPRFASHAARKANEDSLDTVVRAWTHTRDKWAIADLLQGAGVAAAPVEHLRDMLERDPQMPDHYQAVRQPEAPHVDIVIDREAARWVGHELVLERAPILGEHNLYVMQELLGRSDAEFARLIVEDVLR
jgi:crotonobetainyl-CoA:carnitine CoA-transferase CaiB-like acyl-CoA transferase